MNSKLHIVCLDAPSPANYGGAIDMFYKVKALAEAGYRICLHYFRYKPGRSAEGLENHCEEIHAYDRKNFLASLWDKQPYITGSRNNQLLLRRLRSDDAPLLLEGIHCAGLVPHFYGTRKVLIRMHNDEAAYYEALAEHELNPLKRFYYSLESRLLHHFQSQLPKDLPLACVAHNDIRQLRERYGLRNLPFIPSFTPWQELQGQPGRGAYCLYQGNMEVSENRQAAQWLLEHIFPEGSQPLVIAGHNIPTGLMRAYSGRTNVRFVSDPPEAEMEMLVREAHLNVLPSFNTTGLKLKLLHALFCGRHCMTNPAGVEGTAFGGTLHQAERPEDFRALVQKLWEQDFTVEMRENRRIVAEVYSNRRNAEAISAWL